MGVKSNYDKTFKSYKLLQNCFFSCITPLELLSLMIHPHTNRKPRRKSVINYLCGASTLCTGTAVVAVSFGERRKTHVKSYNPWT